MASFQQVQVKAKVNKDLFDFIRGIEKELVAYNRATLHDDSVHIHGRPIGFYSYGTEMMTDGRKKAGEPFDLLETGEFLDRLFATVSNSSIFFNTSDPKKREVFKNLLTNDIFGLQDDDLNKVIQTRILPFFLKYFRANLT